MTDDSAPRRRSAPRLPVELFRDEHVDAIGMRAMRVLLRLLVASCGERMVWSSAGWLALEFSRRGDGTISPRRHDASGVRHALAQLEELGYLRRTGNVEARSVAGRRVEVHELELLRERWEIASATPEERVEASAETCDPESRPIGGVTQDPRGRDCASRVGVTVRHAKSRDETGDERAAAARPSDAPPAAAAEPIPTEDTNLASFFAPMPLELARAWFSWWFPTDRAGLSETWAMGERHRTIRTLVELWNRFGDERDWRAMFGSVQRSELRSIRSLEATLARIGASRAQQRAPIAAAASALPPEQRCAVAGCTAQATYQHRTSGARYCAAHAALAARRDPSIRDALAEIGDAEPAAPLAAAATTQQPRSEPIVQQRARERPPRASAAERATA